MITRFNRSRVCGIRPRTALAIAYGKNGVGRFVSSACSLFDRSAEKRKKKKKHDRQQQSSQRPPQPSHSFKTARPRWKESKTRSELGETSCRPLWARHRLGRRESRRYYKECKPHLVLPPFRESPKSITRQTVAIRHRIPDHHIRCPPTDHLPACCYRR